MLTKGPGIDRKALVLLDTNALFHRESGIVRQNEMGIARHGQAAADAHAALGDVPALGQGGCGGGEIGYVLRCNKLFSHCVLVGIVFIIGEDRLAAAVAHTVGVSVQMPERGEVSATALGKPCGKGSAITDESCRAEGHCRIVFFVFQNRQYSLRPVSVQVGSTAVKEI